jgi:hypothetical protein
MDWLGLRRGRGRGHVPLLELRRGHRSLEHVRRVIVVRRVHLLHGAVPYIGGCHELSRHLLLVLLKMLLLLRRHPRLRLRLELRL